MITCSLAANIFVEFYDQFSASVLLPLGLFQTIPFSHCFNWVVLLSAFKATGYLSFLQIS